MAVVDVATKTLTLKVVYYGCALGGKTTNLISLHHLTDPEGRQGLVSIATNDDRTLFFDLLPMEMGQIGGLTTRVQLYTVPGQVHYETTRRQVLRGADGVVLVIDSDPQAAESNLWARENLRLNLRTNGLDPNQLPTVLQWNKRDLADARAVAELEAELNPQLLPTREAVAKDGIGVIETFIDVLKRAVARTAHKTGRTLSQELIDAKIEAAFEHAPRGGVRVPGADKRAFSHRFDMDSYRDSQAERGRDRRVVDQESLLSEAVNTNMMLAERLDSLKHLQRTGEKRSTMMVALGRLAPMLAEPDGEALPAGVTALLLGGGCRCRGSLLLSRPGDCVMEEREVVPGGVDLLNHTMIEGLGSIANRICNVQELQVFDDIVSQVFMGQTPVGADTIASLLIAPVACDGIEFGAFVVYGTDSEPAFDATQCEYWKTAATLVGLSIHWRALRRRVARALVS